MPPAADADDRAAARLRLDANVVVEAGAGTGKTTLLTDRLQFLLLGRNPPVPVTALVALTFTEKAAGEIKVRLAERLSETAAYARGEALPAASQERAEKTLTELLRTFSRTSTDAADLASQALEDLDKAQIGTIHSFASHLLRLYPLEAGVDPGFTVDEGDRFAELFSAEWAQWLDRELGVEAPRQDQWLEVLRLAPLEDLESLARALCGEGLELDGLGGPDPATAGWIEGLIAELDGAVQGQPEPHRASKIKETLQDLRRHLKSLSDAAKAGALAAPPALAKARFTAAWPKAWDPAGESLYDRARGVAEESSAEAEALVRRAVGLLDPFARSFRVRYTRAGLVSFDGLLRKARDLLRGQPAVREELKARYEAILIDEFQDTDPLQGELLMYLAEAPGEAARDWRKARLAPGRLFVVGDPKQSIYRFRGADIAAYQSFTERATAGPKAIACDLKANFRCPASLISAVNAVFARLMVESPGLQAPYKDLLPGPQPPEGGLELAVVEGGDEADAELLKRSEAEWLSAWVRENCGAGKRWRYKDVAVLVRSASPVPAILDVFKAAGVPYAVDVEKHFYGAPEVLDLVNLLKSLDDPEDRLALAGLLRSPLGCVDDLSLYRMARAGELDYAKDPKTPAGEDRERLKRLFAVLRSLRARVGREPLGRVVHAALEETALLELAAKAYHGAQTVSNLNKFLRLAAEASEGRGLTLKEFIGEVIRGMDDPRGEGESPLADEHLEAVRILTIHKSKGLEFPVVFLANAAARRGGGGGEKAASAVDWSTGSLGLRLPRTAASAAMSRLKAQEELRLEHETVRLLYVAMTRAKSRLCILGAARADASSLAALLARAGAWPEDRLNDWVAIGAQRVPVIRVPLAKAGPRSAPPTSRLEEAPSAEELAAVWRGRRRRFEEASERVWTRSPTEELQEPEKGARLEPYSGRSPTAVLVGSLCHKVLEGWDFRGGGDLQAAVERSRTALERLDPDGDWDKAASEARKILKGFLSSDAAKGLANAEILGREIPFVYSEAGGVVRGTIDLLYKEGAKIFVADYKTGAVAEKDLKILRERHRRQGEAYCAAVEKALGVEGSQFRLIFLRRPELA